MQLQEESASLTAVTCSEMSVRIKLFSHTSQVLIFSYVSVAYEHNLLQHLYPCIGEVWNDLTVVVKCIAVITTN